MERARSGGNDHTGAVKGDKKIHSDAKHSTKGIQKYHKWCHLGDK